MGDQDVKSETVDPVVVRHCLAILDGEKEVIRLLADRLQELQHPCAKQLRELYSRQHYSAPRDESLAVLLALPDKMGWLLACDFTEHFMKETYAQRGDAPKHPTWGYGYAAALINYAYLAHAVLRADKVIDAMKRG
jgi:hypothetical protein